MGDDPDDTGDFIRDADTCLGRARDYLASTEKFIEDVRQAGPPSKSTRKNLKRLQQQLASLNQALDEFQKAVAERRLELADPSANPAAPNPDDTSESN